MRASGSPTGEVTLELRRARGDGGLVVAGAADPRPRRARGGVQDGAGGDLPPQPRALPAGRRGRDRRTRSGGGGAHVRVRRRRVRGGGGAGRARGPRPRRDAELPDAGRRATCDGCWWRRPAGSCPSSRRISPRYAQGQLEERGIEVLLDTRLESAEGGAMRLSDGQTFAADTLVWTAGVKPSPLAGLSGLPVDERGRILVDDHLRVVGVPDAWAAGDIAAVPDRDDRRAGAAHRAARDAAGPAAGPEPHRHAPRRRAGAVRVEERRRRVFARALQGRRERVRGQGQGVPGWFLHRSYHLLAMPTIGRRVRIAMDWTVALLFPRDITQLGLVRASARAVRARGEPVDGLRDAARRPCAAASAVRSRPAAPCGCARCRASRGRPRAPRRPTA